MKNSLVRTPRLALAALAVISGCADAGPVPPAWDVAESGPVHVDDALIRGLSEGDVPTALIQLRPGETAADFEDVQREFPNLGLIAVTLRSTAALERMVESGAVDGVFANVPLRRTSLELEGLDLINQPVAGNRGFTGHGKTVAVLDSGVDFTHEDFGGCAAAGEPGCAVVFAADFAPDDGVRDDSRKHGTNVAGLVRAVAPDVGIAALDVFKGDVAWSDDVLAAIEWSIENRDEYGIVALNMSLGTDNVFSSACGNSVFARPILAAKQAGIAAVVSAGNGGKSEGVSAPGCVDEAVTVGASYGGSVPRLLTGVCDDFDAEPDDIACFSNSSPLVDIIAPGVRVRAGGVTMTGTSQAAPHIAGSIAVIASTNYYAHPDDWVATLKESGTTVWDQRNSLRFPRVDLDAATLMPSGARPPAEDGEEPGPIVADPEPEPLPERDPDDRDPETQPEPQPEFGDYAVTINDGEPTTNSRDVVLRVAAPAPTMICVSEDSRCTSWQQLDSNITFSLSEGHGEKTVNVWFLATDGRLYAEVHSDTITYVP